MEVIRIPGYTEDEKVEIAKRHLIKKQMEAHGLKEGEWSISDDALRELIRYYTREAGVRNLERELANLTRKAVKEILLKGEKGGGKVSVTRRNLEKFAGVKRYPLRRGGDGGSGRRDHRPGLDRSRRRAAVDRGGRWCRARARSRPDRQAGRRHARIGAGGGKLCEKSRSVDFGIKPTEFARKKDIHVHVPEGATPKDGPSAGVAMITSIVSVLTGIAVRKDLAMTGEITLRGRVLPIGGLKEKLLAALRGRLKTVLIPKDNEKDLAEIPDNVKRGLTIKAVGTVDEVLAEALTEPLEAIEWIEPAEVDVGYRCRRGHGRRECRPALT